MKNYKKTANNTTNGQKIHLMDGVEYLFKVMGLERHGVYQKSTDTVFFCCHCDGNTVYEPYESSHSGYDVVTM